MGDCCVPGVLGVPGVPSPSVPRDARMSRMCRQYFPGDAKIAKFPRIARLNTWARLRLASTRNLTKWL